MKINEAEISKTENGSKGSQIEWNQNLCKSNYLYFVEMNG